MNIDENWTIDRGNQPTDLPYRKITDLRTHQAPPLLLIHGTADLNVPWQQSQLLFQKYVDHKRPVTFYLMTNQPHDMPYLNETEHFTSRIVQESTASGIRYPMPHPPMTWERLVRWLKLQVPPIYIMK